ncbi:hypothetical protein REPUB_Repub16aG0102100 [Reevesia pubescens]
MASKEESAATGQETDLKRKNPVGMASKEESAATGQVTDLKRKNPVGTGMDDPVIPKKFKCPLSGQIMTDPVILITGQTYDRPSIQKWLNEAGKCDLSRQVFSHTILTPNCLVRELISEWSKEHGVAIYMAPEELKTYLTSLLEKMPSSLADQKEAAKELRRLTTGAPPASLAAFCELPDAITRLLSPLSESVGKVESDLAVEEDLIVTVSNLSIHPGNKKPIAENPVVIPLLIKSLSFGTTGTKQHAARAIARLSEIKSTGVIFGNSGALVPLLELIRTGHHPLEVRLASYAIFSMCTASDNLAKFIAIDQAVELILEKVWDAVFREDMVSILVLVSRKYKTIDSLRQYKTLRGLLKIIRDTSSETEKESCVEILDNLCKKDLSLLLVIKAEDITNPTLAKLANTGTEKARQKANRIIEKIGDEFP